MIMCCLQATIYCYPSTALHALSLVSPQLGILLICTQSPFWMVTALIGAYSSRPLQRQRQDVGNVAPPYSESLLRPSAAPP